MPNKVLVTGSEGFVGARLASALEAKGTLVWGLDISKGNDLCEPIVIPDEWDFDIVVHLAAIKSVPAAFADPHRFLRINYLATLNTLELCRRRQVPIIYMSSYLYGTPQYLPIDEVHPLAPHNPYAQSKLLSEELCVSYNRDFGVEAVILRPFNLYGPGLYDDSLIPNVIRQIPSGRVRLGDPEPKRDYLYVDDLCRAILACLDIEKIGLRVYNLGSGQSISVGDITRKIIDISGCKATIEFEGKRRQGEVMDCVADIGKASRELGWQPSTALDEGLRSMLCSALLTMDGKE
jgi:UDP-glucose 4-epimerase